VYGSGWTTLPDFGGQYETMDLNQRYPLELCEWITDDNECRSFYKEGSEIDWDNGERLYEYNEEENQLQIGPSRVQGRGLLAYFQSVRDRLEQLRGKGTEVIELGQRQIGDREAIGWRVVKRNNKREDLWLDTKTHLVLEIQDHILRDGQWHQWRHGSLVYDQEIPSHIRNYTVPDADKISYDSSIDPRYEKWNHRLQQIASYYQEHPLPDTMELIDRESENAFDAIAASRRGRVPGIKGISVKPVTWYLRDFLRSRVRPVGSLRVPQDLKMMELNFDLIVRDGQTEIDEVHFVLDALGLEWVESVEQRRVWLAHYDGRSLKPWEQVKAPVPRGDARHTMPGMDWNSSRATMPQLLNSFVAYQAMDLTANSVLIVDETGLPGKEASGETLYVSSASPNWRGEECLEMARQWFEEQFGVTFTQEIRPMTVYSVQRR
ncbi:MAG: hypothetical protein HQ515_13530, partial [Phycisphaeraceae bacterium]|nr:hypothetical protein [Phycisphaeraceae bacterium]